jgi:hypothetical protein
MACTRYIDTQQTLFASRQQRAAVPFKGRGTLQLRSVRQSYARRSIHRCAAANSGGSAGDHSGGSGDSPSEQAIRRQARALNELFYSSGAPEAEAGGTPHPEAAEAAGPATDAAPSASARLLADLPLWRVQWAALPGSIEVLHVHAPHYVAMFERLLRGLRPHRFGHLYLPEGSKNLGSPEYALAPGSKASTFVCLA